MGRLLCMPCGNPFSDRLTQCPHCARLAVAYPNVVDAQRPEEREALALRVEQAARRARQRGVEKELEGLKAALQASTAVRVVRSHELERLVSSEHSAMATYYRQLQSGLRLPEEPTGGSDWDRLRRIAEAAAFSTYAEDLQFAALTVDERWPSSYGHAALFLREDCIAHRASVFEDNVVLWMKEQGVCWDVPPGHRASWNARAELGVAKLADELTPRADLPALVLEAGATTADDSMIEVHVHGPMTIRSVKVVEVRADRVSAGFRRELNERADACGFHWRAVA